MIYIVPPQCVIIFPLSPLLLSSSQMKGSGDTFTGRSTDWFFLSISHLAPCHIVLVTRYVTGSHHTGAENAVRLCRDGRGWLIRASNFTPVDAQRDRLRFDVRASIITAITGKQRQEMVARTFASCGKIGRLIND